MLKGLPLEKRDSRWHRRHLLKLAHRERVRKAHLTATAPEPKQTIVAQKPNWWQRLRVWFKKIFS